MTRTDSALSMCKEDAESDDGYTLSGYVQTNGNPTTDVIIIVDDFSNLKAISDADGYFEIHSIASLKMSADCNSISVLSISSFVY